MIKGAGSTALAKEETIHDDGGDDERTRCSGVGASWTNNKISMSWLLARSIWELK